MDRIAEIGYEREAIDSLLAAIVESSDDAIIGKNLDGIVISWNQAARRIFGYTAEEMIGQPISRLAPPERVDEMPAILDRIKRGERVEHFETVRITKDGRRLNIALTVSPIHNSAGEIIGASKISRDITEKKLAEEALAKQAEQLIRANADLQQFAYVTSHDLQEPLRTVLACTEMFLSKCGHKLHADEREWLELSMVATRRMTGMIKDLLTYAQTMNEELPMDWVPIAQVIHWVSNNLHLAVQSSSAQIIYNEREMPVVYGNKIALVQLFQNLLSNSLKYRSEESPRIEISAQRTNAHWLFSVRDNGIGIAPAYHERIFIVFQRLYRNEYPGTGIGLALCRKIVQTHGGEIWVESDVGKGSTFKFTLPAKENS